MGENAARSRSDSNHSKFWFQFLKKINLIKIIVVIITSGQA